MPIKLTTTDARIQHVNILVYGESGIGKTTLCATAPNPLIISAEGGLMSLRKFKIPVFEISKRDDCDEIYDWLKLSAEAKKFDTICLDSLSEIAEVLLSDEKAVNKDTRAAYGTMADEMAILVRGFRDLPKHVYMTAKLKRIIDDTSGAVTFAPSMPGKVMLDALPYLYDEVFAMRYGQLQDGTKYRYLQTAGDRQYPAKDRSGTLRPVERPHLGHVISTMLAVEEEKPTQ